MTKVLFVCHGNICRSPMAKFILKDMITKKGLQNEFEIDSAAVSYEEEGNSIYPPAKKVLNKYNILLGPHKARRIEKTDYEKFDYIICMDQSNVFNIMRILVEDPSNKIHKLLDFTDYPRDISDPWYTGDFDLAFQDIYKGLKGFLEYLNIK